MSNTTVSFNENGLLFDNEVETIFFDEELDRTTVTASNVGSINESNTNFTNANKIEDANRFLSSTLDVDQLLTDGSVMFPTMNDSNDGDVNDLFGELELLLAVSEPPHLSCILLCIIFFALSTCSHS